MTRLPNMDRYKFPNMNPISITAADGQHIECPRCVGAMDLVRTRKAIAGRDLQMFECRACEYVQVMSLDPVTSVMAYVLSGSRPLRCWPVPR